MNIHAQSNPYALTRTARRTGLLAVLNAAHPAGGIADLGLLQVRGPGAAEFLHGQLSNEVKALQPGEGNRSARLTRSGALVSILSLHRLPEDESSVPGFALLLERGGVPSLREDLERYLFSEALRLEDASERFDWIILQGPEAPAVLSGALGRLEDAAWAALPENAVRRLRVAGIPEGGFVFVHSLAGDPGYLLAVPRAGNALAALRTRLEPLAREKELLILNPQEAADVLEVLRVEAGIVRMDVDVEPGRQVLPETGLERQLVSYAKGCFLGQEVIARIRTYGSTPLALRGLIIETPPPRDGAGPADPAAFALANLPDPGSDLVNESGRKLGRVVSRTLSPMLGAPVALAYLERASRTPGAKLRLQGKREDFNAEVALLPFYNAADRNARARFLHDRAIRLFAEHRDGEAIALLEEALRLDPSLADAYEALGVILGRAERYREAIEIFKRLEEVAPDEPMVHTNLSLFYMRLGDKETAEEEQAKATVKRFSGFASRAQAEQKAKQETERRRADAEQKIALFEEVLAIDADDPLALFGIGNAHAALEQWEKAAEYLSRACAVQQGNSAVYLALGKALEKLDRPAAALEAYEKGIAAASRKGDLMPLKEMQHRALLLQAGAGAPASEPPVA